MNADDICAPGATHTDVPPPVLPEKMRAAFEVRFQTEPAELKPTLAIDVEAVDQNDPWNSEFDHRQRRPDAHWAVLCGSRPSTATAAAGLRGSRQETTRTMRLRRHNRRIPMTGTSPIGCPGMTPGLCEICHMLGMSSFVPVGGT